MSHSYPTEFPGFGQAVKCDVHGPYHSYLSEDSLRFVMVRLVLAYY